MRLKSTLALLLACIFIAFLATSALSDVWVNGYYRKDGTYVGGHYRSDPDGDPYNNWSYPGNINPYTGKVAPGNPSTYLENYYNQTSFPESYDFNYNNQAFEDWLSKTGDTEESGSSSSYSSDTQAIEDWLLEVQENEESKDESESISESPDPYQAIIEWLEDMRTNKEFEEWFIRYRKERGEFNQEDISKLYNLHLAIPSATTQEFIELFDKFFRYIKRVNQ